MLAHKDVVYLAIQGELTARDAATGQAMWSAACATAGYKAPASIFIVNDLVWDVAAGGEPYRPGSDPSKINRTYTGYDLRTGEVVKEIPVSGKHGYAIMHHRCHVPRASGKSIITSFPGIEFFDVETGESTHDSWLRGACLYGFMPANGLIYTPPHPCACYTQGKLTGFWAVAGQAEPLRSEEPDRPTRKGPSLRYPPASRLQPPASHRLAHLPSRRGAKRHNPGDLQVRGMALAGEGEEKRLFVAGAKGDWVVSQSAYEGKRGSVVRVISIDDGTIIAERNLPGLPIFDGMSAACGSIYISLANGRVLCFGE